MSGLGRRWEIGAKWGRGMVCKFDFLGWGKGGGDGAVENVPRRVHGGKHRLACASPLPRRVGHRAMRLHLEPPVSAGWGKETSHRA